MLNREQIMEIIPHRAPMLLVDEITELDSEHAVGTLHLTGAQLNMAALDLETGEAKFTGRIDTLEYTVSAPAGGFLRRLLR